MKASGWEIFYKDGSSYNSKQFNWNELPVDNVLLMIVWHDQFDKEGNQFKTICSGKDYYFMINPFVWGNCNEEDKIFEKIKTERLLSGIWIDDKEMNDLEIICRNKVKL